MPKARQFAKMPCALVEQMAQDADLPPEARLVYWVLRGQADVNFAGIISIRLARWARATGLPRDTVIRAINLLQETGWVAVDMEVEELLLCRFIDTDEIWRVPNSMKAAAGYAIAAVSPIIKAVLYQEMRQLLNTYQPQLHVNDGAGKVVTGLIRHLEGFAYPSATPREPITMGSAGDGSSHAELVSMSSPMSTPGALEDIPDPSDFWAEPDNSKGSGGDRSLKSQVQVPVLLETEDLKPKTQDPHVPAPRGASANQDSDPAARPEVQQLCEHLVAWLKRNGETKLPNITMTWRRDMRLMIDVDGRTPKQLADAIDWCQGNAFWRDKVMSPRKLREKYGQLRQQAEADRARATGQGQGGMYGHGGAFAPGSGQAARRGETTTTREARI